MRLRSLNISILCMQGFFALLNISVGVFSALHHHRTAIINFGGAAVIIAVSISTYRTMRNTEWMRESTRRLTEETALILEEQRRLMAGITTQIDELSPEDREKAWKCARKNLEKVAKALGGKIRCGALYFDNWNISSGYITDRNSGNVTCYFIYSDHAVPYDERIATAALLLRANPELFDYWRTNRNRPRVK